MGASREVRGRAYRQAGHSALLKYLATECSVADKVFDERLPRWLKCRNGTVDLETGVIRPHDPADMLAYCLLGENPEQMVFFIAGPPKPGKTQILYTVREVFGWLAHESQAGLVRLSAMAATPARRTRSGQAAGHDHRDVQLHARRRGPAQEADRGAGDRGGPALREVRLRTPVTFTIALATNDMPALTNFDDAMRERIAVIPGGPTILLSSGTSGWLAPNRFELTCGR